MRRCVCGCSWIVVSSSIWTCTMCHWPSHRCVSSTSLELFLRYGTLGEPLGRHTQPTGSSTTKSSQLVPLKLALNHFSKMILLFTAIEGGGQRVKLTSWQVAFSMLAFHRVTTFQISTMPLRTAVFWSSNKEVLQFSSASSLLSSNLLCHHHNFETLWGSEVFQLNLLSWMVFSFSARFNGFHNLYWTRSTELWSDHFWKSLGQVQRNKSSVDEV